MQPSQQESFGNNRVVSANKSQQPDWQHELLSVTTGARSGLPVAIAIHSTASGPAIGGCRVKTYSSWSAATTDVLKLSRAMTTKCRVAGLPYGGGKTVVATPADRLSARRRDAMIADVADAVAGLGGRYRTGPDIGTTSDDMKVIHDRAGGWAFGRPERDGGSGDSAQATARGVLATLAAGLTFTGLGDDHGLTGVTVGVAGYGNVGSRLALSLARADARVTIYDTDTARRSAAQRSGMRTSEEPLDPGAYDILIPAATGGLLTDEFAHRCRAKLIVGPANNQLKDTIALTTLAKHGTVWIPDVVSSAGGIIGAVCRESLQLSVEETGRRIDGLEATALRILRDAETRRVSVLQAVADLSDAATSADT